MNNELIRPRLTRSPTFIGTTGTHDNTDDTNENKRDDNIFSISRSTNARQPPSPSPRTTPTPTPGSRSRPRESITGTTNTTTNATNSNTEETICTQSKDIGTGTNSESSSIHSRRVVSSSSLQVIQESPPPSPRNESTQNLLTRTGTQPLPTFFSPAPIPLSSSTLPTITEQPVRKRRKMGRISKPLCQLCASESEWSEMLLCARCQEPMCMTCVVKQSRVTRKGVIWLAPCPYCKYTDNSIPEECLSLYFNKYRTDETKVTRLNHHSLAMSIMDGRKILLKTLNKTGRITQFYNPELISFREHKQSGEYTAITGCKLPGEQQIGCIIALMPRSEGFNLNAHVFLRKREIPKQNKSETVASKYVSLKNAGKAFNSAYPAESK